MTIIDILELLLVFLVADLYFSGLLGPILIGIGAFVAYKILRRKWRKHVKE